MDMTSCISKAVMQVSIAAAASAPSEISPSRVAALRDAAMKASPG
jgi:hypothetical protein